MFPNDRKINRRCLLSGSLGAIAASRLGPGGASASEITQNYPEPLRDPESYKIYVPAASKTGQYAHYTCEFDAAWAVMKTFGVDATLDQQIAAIGHDLAMEPYYLEPPDGVVIYGGDINNYFSGDYETNFLARTRGRAMRKVFEAFDLPVRTIKNRKAIEQSLRKQRLIWIKTTVDFKPWVPATWITQTGEKYPAVLGNDHAVIVMGYDDDVVLIRDVLGPTSTNYERPYEYEVPWDQFLACWAAQGSDGLAVG